MHLLFLHPVLGSTVYWEEIPPSHSVSDNISSTFYQNLTGLAMLQILLKEKHLEGSRKTSSLESSVISKSGLAGLSAFPSSPL